MNRPLTLLLMLVSIPAWARPAPTPPPTLTDGNALIIDGTVPDDASNFVLIPFQVPDGIAEIEVKHQNLNSANILDWGLMDPSGYRGWGGGNVEPAVVGLLSASRSYLPGVMSAGTWNVVLGKASIMQKPARYHLEIDFLEISDHNAVSQLDYLGTAQDAHPKILLLPGVEFTTYNGHANGIGATSYVPHEIGLNGITIEGAAQAFQQQGAVFSVNHPALNLSICLGCEWSYRLDPSLISSVEIATGAWSEAGQFFDLDAITFWDSLVAQGRHIPAVGGSDDHRGGVVVGQFHSNIGSPTTMVFARELSASAIVDGIRAGHTVVKLEGATDPMVTIQADDGSIVGDTVHGSTKLHVTVTGNTDGKLQLVKNGKPQDPVAVTADPFTMDVTATAPAAGEDRWRAMAIKDAHPITVTSHIWITQALPVPPVTPQSHGGCSMTKPSFWIVLVALLIVGLRLRRQKH